MTKTADLTESTREAQTIALECFGFFILSPVQATFEEDEDHEEPFDPDDGDDDDLDDDDLDEDDLDEDDEGEDDGDDDVDDPDA
jgi:hypothetical protein